MPWKVVADLDGCAFAVVKEGDEAVVACHDSNEDAVEHVQALYANAEDDGEEFAYDDDSKGVRRGAKPDLRIERGGGPAAGARIGVGAGGAKKKSFALRMEAVEQALCAIADAVYEQRTEEFASGQGGGGGSGGSWSSPRDKKVRSGGINTPDKIANGVASVVKRATKAIGVSTIRAGKRKPTSSTSGRSGL